MLYAIIQYRYLAQCRTKGEVTSLPSAAVATTEVRVAISRDVRASEPHEEAMMKSPYGLSAECLDCHLRPDDRYLDMRQLWTMASV